MGQRFCPECDTELHYDEGNLCADCNARYEEYGIPLLDEDAVTVKRDDYVERDAVIYAGGNE